MSAFKVRTVQVASIESTIDEVYTLDWDGLIPMSEWRRRYPERQQHYRTYEGTVIDVLDHWPPEPNHDPGDEDRR